MLLTLSWGGASFCPIKSESYLSWKIRVSLSNPRSTKNSFPKELSSKHKVEALSLVNSILSISIWGSHFLSWWQTIPSLRTSLKESRTSKHGIIECFSYLKKNDMENYVKEEVADPEGDEDKAKHKKDLVKAKRIKLSPLDLTCIILEDSQGYVWCNGHLVQRWAWEVNSRMWRCICQKTFNVTS